MSRTCFPDVKRVRLTGPSWPYYDKINSKTYLLLGIFVFMFLKHQNEPHREKTGLLPMRKQRRRSASR